MLNLNSDKPPIKVPAKFSSIGKPLSISSIPSNVWLSNNPEKPPKIEIGTDLF
jgi:hypothetical protein